MRKALLPWWTVLFWIAVWVIGVLAATIAQASCAKTSAGATGLTDTAAQLSLPGKGGFRVIATHWDPVLGRRWALLASCLHPEWPAFQLPVNTLPVDLAASTVRSGAERSLPLSSVPMVRAGDAVQLRIQQGDLLIEAAAIAEQNGGLGQTVRVRLTQRRTLGRQMEREFSGVVRGPHDVEIRQ